VKDQIVDATVEALLAVRHPRFLSNERGGARDACAMRFLRHWSVGTFSPAFAS
jgi:hypothetical protein